MLMRPIGFHIMDLAMEARTGERARQVGTGRVQLFRKFLDWAVFLGLLHDQLYRMTCLRQT
jgi:hypothetical protein